MWDLIVSVPDHCLSFYFPRILKIFIVMVVRRYGYFRRKQSKGNIRPIMYISSETWTEDLPKKSQQQFLPTDYMGSKLATF